MDRQTTPLQIAIRATRPAIASAFVLSIFINLALFAAPLYSMQVYDRVLSSRNLSTLAMLTLIVAVFLLLIGILEYARSGILARGGLRFHEALAKPVFETAMRASLAGRTSVGSQALKDAGTLRDALSGKTASALFDVPWTPLFVALCFLFHHAIGFVALTGTILIFLCALLTEMATRRGLAQSTRLKSSGASFAAACLRNAEDLSGLGMGETARLHLTSFQNAALAAEVASGEKSAALLAATKVVRMGVQIALIGVGAWLAIDRLISPGVMMAALIIMGRALQPVEQAVASWKHIIAARSAAKSLDELFQMLPAPIGAIQLPEPRGDISVEGLVVKPANNGAPILKDVSFALEAGTALAIIGPSGGGKSTLVKALAGIAAPAFGTVRLDGAALTQWDATQLGRNIGYLGQDIEFFAGTIAENIARLAAPDEAAIVDSAKSAGVHGAILKLPQGYQTQLGDGGVVLSGGMRQRVALARALYGNPRVLILDEPNASLDIEGEIALSKALAGQKAAGRTIILVTHRPQLMVHADSVLVLNDGRVQAFGARDEVLGRMQSRKNSANVAALRPRAAYAEPGNTGASQAAPCTHPAA